MKRLFLVLALWGLISLPGMASDIFRTKPYLQNPTNNGVTVSWLTNVPVHSWVEYGLSPDDLSMRAETVVDGQVMAYNDKHHIRLKDLKPGTTYYYQVHSREITLYQAYKKEFGETAVSSVYSFRTAPAAKGDFTALFFNDLHKNYETVDAFAEVLKGMDYQFMVYNGDVIDDPKDEAQAVEFFSYVNDKFNAAEAPVVFVRGNHEIRNAYSVRLRDLIDYIGKEGSYGSFDWGDTRFVMLDCGEDKPDTTWVYYGLNQFQEFREEQADFLKQELNTPEFKKASKRVLFHHIPIYAMRGYNPCFELWQPYLKDAPFDIAINGHTHRYAWHPKGTVENNFPVIIGGGPRLDRALVIILEKRGDKLTVSVKNTQGEETFREEL